MVSAETWDWDLIRIFRSQKHARGRQIAGSSGATIDPLHAKLTRRQAQRLAVANAVGHSGRWPRSSSRVRKLGGEILSTASNGVATLATYPYPIIGDFSVAAVDTGLVVQVLDPIWAMKPETASRVRGRIEAVLDAATVRGYREGPNPAQWKGGLAHLLPARAKVRKVAHHAALAFDEMPAFLMALQRHESMAARALEFAILTAARTDEVLGATWGEIDLDTKVWTIQFG